MAPPDFLQGLGAIMGTVTTNVRQFQGNLQRSMQQLSQQASTAVEQMQQQMAQHLQGASRGERHLLASVSARLAGAAARGRRGAQAIMDLAFNPEDLKKRLQAVTVYTVVDAKNQFVLASGEDKQLQLGLFFFKQSDAEAYIETIRSQNPALASQAKVLPTSMDRVYELAITPRDAAGLENVVFRFIPDAQQVERAMQLFRQANVPAPAFTGVPLFQAEGLTVKWEQNRYTPLFFSKDDLDVALAAAAAAKDAEAQADTRAKAEQARADLAAARAELAAAPEAERKAVQQKLDQASQRVERYEQRLRDMKAAATAARPGMRVDVGCLEEVIAKMEMDERGEWGDVMFVPPGAMLEEGEGAGAAEGKSSEGKGKAKGKAKAKSKAK